MHAPLWIGLCGVGLPRRAAILWPLQSLVIRYGNRRGNRRGRHAPHFAWIRVSAIGSGFRLAERGFDTNVQVRHARLLNNA